MFIKFPSIKNTYSALHIQKWLKLFPELNNATYAITEKLHGTNTQLIFDKEQYGDKVLLGTRTQVLPDSENHYNIMDVYSSDKYQTAVQTIQKHIGNDTVNLYGEFFGPGICKNIDYGEKQIRFFAMMVNGRLMSHNDLRAKFTFLGLDPDSYLVPLVGLVDGLQQALNFDITELVSAFTPDGMYKTKQHNTVNSYNLAEGIVIYPADLVFTYGHSCFILKKKNEWAREHIKKKNPSKKIKPSIKTLRNDFERYITKARMESAFSKYGARIQDTREYNIFIPMIINDAKEDFMEDFSDELAKVAPSKDELRFIYNTGGIVAKLLTEELGDQ